MAQQTINLGAAPDDGTGDTLRVGGDKINDNFTELYAADAALGTAAALDVDTDDTLAADSDSLIPTQQAVKAYVDANAGGTASLDDVGDVNAPTPANGDVLTWDSTPGEWVAAAPTGGSNALDDLTDVNAPTPSDGDVLTFDSGSGDWVNQAPAASADLGALHVQDQKASGTAGGTFTSGAWQTRTLNTSVTNTISGASLASNQITLPAGTYDIFARGSGQRVDNHQTRLQNITDAATTLLGSVEHSSNSASEGTSNSHIQGRFTIAGSKVFELQHRCQTTVATLGFGAGAGASWGTLVFADVFIVKVA